MKTDKLIDQLELYSNALVGFMVAQSIAFSFTFGTNTAFSCEITRHKELAAGLVIHFVATTLLSAVALTWLKRTICSLSDAHTGILKIAFLAKIAVVVVFTLIPAGLVTQFGFLGDPATGRCVALAAVKK